MAFLKDEGFGGEPVFYGQSTAKDPDTGIADPDIHFATTATINAIIRMKAEDGIAIRVDFIGANNRGYIDSSPRNVRTFVTIEKIGWGEDGV